MGGECPGDWAKGGFAADPMRKIPGQSSPFHAPPRPRYTPADSNRRAALCLSATERLIAFT